MAISPQQLTIYLYSAHRAVIFAIAQLSCIYCVLYKAGAFLGAPFSGGQLGDHICIWGPIIPDNTVID